MQYQPSRTTLRLTLLCKALQAIGLGMALSPAWAQTAPGVAAQPTELPEVKVSVSADGSAQGLAPSHAGGQVARGARVGLLGTKEVMDTPFSTTAYTSALIAEQQARSVADVLLNDPTVRASRGFGNFQELYMVRGFPVPSDDMTFNGLYGILPRQYLAAEMIERVEVLRGPSSALNGGVGAVSGFGIGGTVNILPKRAGNEDLNRLTVGVENGGHHSLAADLSRRFGPDQKTGVRLNAVHRDGETSVEDEQRSLSLVSVGLDHRESNLRLSADVGYQDHELDRPRPSVTPVGGIPDVKDADANYGQPWTHAKDRSTFVVARAEVDLNDHATAWLALGLREGKEDNRLANPRQTAAGQFSYGRFDNVREDRSHTTEVGLRGTVHMGPIKHQFVASASTFKLSSRNAWTFAGATASGTPYAPVLSDTPPATTFGNGNMDDPLVTQRTTSISLALADTLSFMADRLQLTLGVRQQTFKDRSYDYNTGALDAASVYDKTRTSPMVAAVYRIQPAWSVYGNYIEGLTKGDTAPSTANNPGAKLAPYVAKQLEAGVKYDGKRWGATAAIFQTDKPFGMVNTSNVFVDGGEQRNRGIELQTFGMVTRHVKLLGGVTLLDAEITKSQGNTLNGKDAIGVPGHLLNLGAEWALAKVPGLSLDARVVHTAKQYANADNSWTVPAWTRLDIGARYKTEIAGHLTTLRARIDNVQNRRYWASAGGYPGAGYLVQGAPRTVTVSASIDF